MIRFLVFLIILAAGIFVAPNLMGNQGYVMINAGELVIDATVTSSIIMILGFYFALLAIETLVNRFFYGLGWFNRHSKAKAKKQTETGILALASGDFKKAENLTLKAANKSQAPVLNYLAAAESAQQLGNEKNRDNYLRLAYENADSNNLAVGITQAKLQIKQQQFEQALASLTQLHEQHPKHKVIMTLLKDVYVERQEWIALLALIPKLQKQKLLDKQAADKLTEQCHFNSLAQIAKQQGSTGVLDTFSKLPKALKKDEKYMLEVASQLIKRNDHQAAYLLVMDALAKEFYPDLVALTAQLEISDFHPLIERLRLLQKSREGSGLLATTIGQLLVKESRWQDAITELNKGISQSPSLAAYSALATAYEKTNKPGEASNVYKQGFAYSLQG